MRIPLLDALPKPQKKVSGMDMTKAHGQEMTRKVSARYTQTLKDAFDISRGGKNANTSAAATTTGV